MGPQTHTHAQCIETLPTGLATLNQDSYNSAPFVLDLKIRDGSASSRTSKTIRMKLHQGFFITGNMAVADVTS